MLCRACLVNNVDRFVGQFAVVDITRRQFNRGADRIGGVFHIMVAFEIRLQPAQNFHRILNGWFIDVNLLEAARERAVFFKMLTELFIGCRSHAAQFAALQRGLKQV